MANVTISGLSTAATTLNDADLFETEQGGSSKKVAASVIADYLAGGGLSDGVKLGGTAAANLLDDYEEGTWTPSLDTETITPTIGTASYSGSYIKIGGIVFCTADIDFDGTGNFAVDDRFIFTGLPYPKTDQVSVGQFVGISSYAGGAALFGHLYIQASELYGWISHIDGTVAGSVPLRLEFRYDA